MEEQVINSQNYKWLVIMKWLVEWTLSNFKEKNLHKLGIL